MTVEEHLEVRHVNEVCRSETLGLAVDTVSSGPEGDTHLTLDYGQRGEPPSEAFTPPANYAIADIYVPADTQPPPAR